MCVCVKDKTFLISLCCHYDKAPRDEGVKVTWR